MKNRPEPSSTADVGGPAKPEIGLRAGVGFSEAFSSRDAAVQAAREASTRAGPGDVSVTFLFATSKHAPAPLLEGVRSVVGEGVPVVGGSAVGVITNDRLGFEGHQVGVGVVHSEALEIGLFSTGALDEDERAAGRRLGRKVASLDPDGEDALLLFYDIVKRRKAEGLSLNMATPFLDGFAGEVGGRWPSTAGGGLLGDLHWNPTYQFLGDRVDSQTATALLLRGGLRMDVAVLRGCKPSSDYHTITKADGNVVLELDGEPIADVVAELMGQESDESAWEDYPIFITLGVNKGEKFGPYREDDYAVRLCMDVDRERRGLVFFGDDLVAGTEVQLMRRLTEVDYVTEKVDALLADLDREGRTPRMALYIDCAGRSSAMNVTDRDEAEVVQEALGDRVPLLGWYVGGEIGPAAGTIESHNFTGMFCVLSE